MEQKKSAAKMFGFSKEKEVQHSIDRIFDSGEEFSNRKIYRKVMTHYAGAKDRAAERDAEVRKRKMKQHVHDLISNSTLHGLHFCADKGYIVRRTIWTLLILVALGLSMQKVYESTQHFFTYPFSTTTTIKYEDSMTFPAVSFCNLNDFRYSEMTGTTLHSILTEGGSWDELKGDEYTTTIRKANHRIEDMLYKCSIKGEDCSGNNFTQFFHNQGDRCFTFNSGDSGHKLIKVENVGLGHALELTINIQHFDYYPDTSESGIHLILHGQDETPVKMQGVILSPGFKTYVEVKKRTVKNLPYPYKTNCGKLQLNYFQGYSMHLCWLEKLTDYVVKNCGCKDWFMPGSHEVCSLSKSLDCMWPHWTKFDKQKMYDCPLPCKIDTYVPTLSIARYPANNEADNMAKTLKLNGSVADNRIYLRDNYLRVIIYYGELSYESMTQIPSYDLMVLLGDIGGQLGLFLGSSLLTYIEFFDCIAMVMYTRFFEVFKRQPAKV